MQEVIEVNQNLVEDVGKAVVSCLVVGSFCGFVFMAKKAASRPGSILLNFSLLYPSHQVKEESLVKELVKKS